MWLKAWKRLFQGGIQSTRKLSTPTIVADLPPCDFVPRKYVGPLEEEMKVIRDENLSATDMRLYRKPLNIHQGHMQYLYDMDNNRYLDMFAGIATITAGHCHPKINKAMKVQMDKLWHTSNAYYHPTIQEYARKLTEKLPDPLKVVFFANSGSEANDLALFMARLYTGRMDTMVMRGCFHGASPVSMGLTSIGAWYYNYPSATSIHKIRNADPYRGLWGGKACRDSPVQADRQCSCQPGHCEASDYYMNEVEDVLMHCSPENKMGPFFMESIQGNGGAVQFPKTYIKRAYAAVREKGGVCIADEVQTGFGRTGEHYWGFQGHHVVPDIVTVGKGVGNGFPLAAVITSKEIASVMSRAKHFNTFGGNPLACTAGMAVLDVIEEEKLQQNADKLGTYLLLELAKLRDEYEVVGDVRGKGFIIGVDLVADKKSKAPIAVEVFKDILEDLKDMRVLVGVGGPTANVLRFKPPMCITKDDVDYTVACCRQAFENQRNRQAQRN